MDESLRSRIESYVERGYTEYLPILALDDVGAEIVLGYKTKVECIRLPWERP